MTASNATAARVCQLVAEGDPGEARRLAAERTPDELAELAAAVAEIVAMLATAVDGPANVAIVHAECATPGGEPLTPSGVVDLARAAVALAGRYLTLDGDDPDDTVALFAEGVIYETEQPHERKSHARHRRHSRPRRP